MKDLTKKIPIELTQTLNKFNNELEHLQSKIGLSAESKSVSAQNSNREQIVVSYQLKNSSYFFHINFVVELDLINWKYYPHNNTSTKTTTSSQINSNDNGAYKRLLNALQLWKNKVINVIEIEDPIDYFRVDKFIKFYSSEIIDEYPITEEQKQLPMPSERQKKALRLLGVQREFIQSELEDEKDINSDKYIDLNLAKELIEKIEEELPRLTEAEVKQNWSISLAGIKKWCENKFLTFLAADNNNDYSLSRSLGSFVGGALNLPNFGV